MTTSKNTEEIKMIKNDFGFYEVENKPSEQELEEYYRSIYFQTSQGAYEEHYSEEEIKYFTNSNAIKFKIVDDHLGQTQNDKRRLLDVGCGEGFSMDYFFKQGWEVLGLDYSMEGIRKQNPNLEKFVRQGDIYQQLSELENQKFEVITLFNVLEHVIDPIGILTSMQKLLSSNGVLIIQVPNDFSLLQNKLFEEGKITRQFWVKTPDHLNYFSKDSLNNLCVHLEMKMIKCISDFPIDYFLANPDSNYIENSQKGKNCHNARIWLDNMHTSISLEKTIELYEAFANIGAGRQISSYFVKS